LESNICVCKGKSVYQRMRMKREAQSCLSLLLAVDRFVENWHIDINVT